MKRGIGLIVGLSKTGRQGQFPPILDKGRKHYSESCLNIFPHPVLQLSCHTGTQLLKWPGLGGGICVFWHMFIMKNVSVSIHLRKLGVWGKYFMTTHSTALCEYLALVYSQKLM